VDLLVVGSVAIDTVETPAGRAENAVGGAATYFALAASFFTPVRMVAAIGSDFPQDVVDDLRRRGVDVDGLEVREGNHVALVGALSRGHERP